MKKKNPVILTTRQAKRYILFGSLLAITTSCIGYYVIGWAYIHNGMTKYRGGPISRLGLAILTISLFLFIGISAEVPPFSGQFPVRVMA